VAKDEQSPSLIIITWSIQLFEELHNCRYKKTRTQSPATSLSQSPT